MTGIRIIFVAISAATGAWFTLLAALSVMAIAAPVRRFHPFSVVVAAVSVYLGYVAFRAAVAAHIDEETFVAALRRGMVGAIISMVLIFVLLLMFRTDFEPFVAHSIRKPTSSFTSARLLMAFAIMGFGTGFVLRTRKTVDPT